MDLVTRALGLSTRASTITALGLVAVGLGASWALLAVLGGPSTVPPHWFYVVILFAAARLGYPGALATAIASGLLSGPLNHHALGGDAALVSEWVSRTGFFVIVGLAAVALLERAIRTVQEEQEREVQAAEILDALEAGEFSLAYQPIVDLGSDLVLGFEALLRWDHPRRGPIRPNEFVPVAERTGVISELGTWVLRKACEINRRVNAQLDPDPPLFVSVNVSPHQLLDDGLVRQVRAVLEADDPRPLALHLEVTESAMIEDTEAAIAVLGAIRELGGQIAIDDFGTGYASLTYAQQLPIDALKIDRTFVSRVMDDERSRRIVESAIALSRALGIHSIAEGVETRQEAELLASLGCEWAQGYYLSPAVDWRSLVIMLEAERRRAAEELDARGSTRSP